LTVRSRKLPSETTIRLLLRQAANRMRRSGRSTTTPFAQEMDANQEFESAHANMAGPLVVALIFFVGVTLLWLKMVGSGGA